jgi:hypothetical protein
MRVDSFEVEHYWGAGGLMVRDTLDNGSMHYSVLLTKSGNRLFNVFRECNHCNKGSNDSPRNFDRSMYLKITKTGNVFQAFVRKIDSDSDDDWVQFGETKTINFSSDHFYVGIAVCSRDDSKTAELTGGEFAILRNDVHLY